MKQLHKIRGRLIKKYHVTLDSDALIVWLTPEYTVKIRRWRWDKSGVVYIKYTIQHNNELLFIVKAEITNGVVDGQRQQQVALWTICGKSA